MQPKYTPSVALRLQGFIRTYTGKSRVGDTAANRGQCVGLIEVWLDSLRLAHIWGNAADLLANADPSFYKKVRNIPTNFPVPGDIVVFGPSWGGGFGHTGICVTGEILSMALFQQNDPDGSTPHLKVYAYDGVLGWLHPIVTS